MTIVTSVFTLLQGIVCLELLGSLIGPTLAILTPAPNYRIPTVYVTGDSLTIGGPVGTDGWGNYLRYSLDKKAISVNNSAIAGESARRFTREGHFAAIAEVVERGDWVIIEFGHNDAGAVYPASQDNGRGDCPGAGIYLLYLWYKILPSYEALTGYPKEMKHVRLSTSKYLPESYIFMQALIFSTSNQTEIVQTYPTYIKSAARLFLARGAQVIVSSPTPNNPWETGNFTWGAGLFAWYAWLSVEELGGPGVGVYYLPHGEYAAQAMKNLGKNVVDENYPVDHGHTAPYLASVVAQAFVLGLKCGTSPLQGLVVNATSRIEGMVLGSCLPANETMPI